MRGRRARSAPFGNFKKKEFAMPVLYEKRGHIGWLP